MTPSFLIPYGEGAVVAAMLGAAALIFWLLLDIRELKRALREEIDRADGAERLAACHLSAAARAGDRGAKLMAEVEALRAKLAKYDRPKGVGGKFIAKPPPARVADQGAA